MQRGLGAHTWAAARGPRGVGAHRRDCEHGLKGWTKEGSLRDMAWEDERRRGVSLRAGERWLRLEAPDLWQRPEAQHAEGVHACTETKPTCVSVLATTSEMDTSSYEYGPRCKDCLAMYQITTPTHAVHIKIGGT